MTHLGSAAKKENAPTCNHQGEVLPARAPDNATKYRLRCFAAYNTSPLQTSILGRTPALRKMLTTPTMRVETTRLNPRLRRRPHQATSPTWPLEHEKQETSLAFHPTHDAARPQPNGLHGQVFNNAPPPLLCHLRLLLGFGMDGSTSLRLFLVAAVTGYGRCHGGLGHLVDVEEGHPQCKGSYWPRRHHLARLLHTLGHHDPYYVRHHCKNAR